VYFHLYEISGNLRDHDRGLALLEEAVTMEPGNSVLLINTASQLIDRAYMDTVGDAIRFGTINATPDRSMLSWLYSNEQERKQVYDRLRGDEHMKKGLAYLDKVMLLAPRSPSSYWLAVGLYAAFDDLDQLKLLQQRLQATPPDLDQVVESAREAYSGAKEAQQRQHMEGEISRHESLLSLPAVTEHAPTLLFVKTELNGVRQGAFVVGLPTDTAQVLSEARKLYEEQPGTVTRSALISALLLRLHDQLSRTNPQYAELATSTRRSLSPQYLMLHLIQFNHPLADTIRSAAEFTQAVQLIREGCAAFPSTLDATDWAMVNTVFPADAKQLRPGVQAYQVGRLRDELNHQLNPASVTAAIEESCARRFAGDEAGAREACEQAIKEGLPLPPI
jgi:hypothetical protein